MIVRTRHALLITISAVGLMVATAHAAPRCEDDYATARDLLEDREGTYPLDVEWPLPGSFTKEEQGAADIEIRGSYEGKPAPIEARWNKGSWETIDPAPAKGAFRGYLKHQKAGLGELQVRFAGRLASKVSVKDVGIGFMLVIAGQSNALMWMETAAKAKSPSTSLALAVNPCVDSSVFKRTVDPLTQPGIGSGPGSVWPLVADWIYAKTNIPVHFITAAENGVPIEDWDPAYETGLYGRMLGQVDLATGGYPSFDENGFPRPEDPDNFGTHKVTGLIWHQGAGNVMLKTSREAYKKSLMTLADTVQHDLGVPMLVSRLEKLDVPWYPKGYVEQIREAQKDATDKHPSILLGPDAFNFPTVDGEHFSDAARPHLLRGWCAGIQLLPDFKNRKLDCETIPVEEKTATVEVTVR